MKSDMGTPVAEVNTTVPSKEDLREAFGSFDDQKGKEESIDPRETLVNEVTETIGNEQKPADATEAETFLKGEEVVGTFEEVPKDNRLVNFAKEKFPETYGRCNSILDIAKVTVKEVGRFNVKLTKEYYSIQLVVGGAMILATGLGGHIGGIVGRALIGVGYKYSEFLNKNFKQEDIDKIIGLYKGNKKEKVE